MIVQPADWRDVGRKMMVEDLDRALTAAIADVDCATLSFSGGVDSCLLLWYMLAKGERVAAATLDLWKGSPDAQYARRVHEFVRREYGPGRMTLAVIEEAHEWPQGDEAVARFYAYLRDVVGCSAIVAGDGIDEFAAGYYAHAKAPSDSTYHRILGRLQADHLAPLDENSGSVAVWLPYLDYRVRSVLLQMPLGQKMEGGRKGILKRLAREKGVPAWVLARRKCAFGQKGMPK